MKESHATSKFNQLLIPSLERHSNVFECLLKSSSNSSKKKSYLPCPEQFHTYESETLHYQDSIVVCTQNRALNNRGVILETASFVTLLCKPQTTDFFPRHLLQAGWRFRRCKTALEKACITKILGNSFVKSTLYMEWKQHSWHPWQKKQNGTDYEVASLYQFLKWVISSRDIQKKLPWCQNFASSCEQNNLTPGTHKLVDATGPSH